MIVDITIPKSWSELTQEQLRYAYFLLSSKNYEPDQIKALCIIRWGKLENMLENIKAEQLAAFLPVMNWILTIPDKPVYLDMIQGHEALYRADLQGLPFEQYLVLENFYQGFMHTKNEERLSDMAKVLYVEQLKLAPLEAYSIFMWFAAVKRLFASRFTHFFQPALIDNQQSEQDIFTALRKSMNTQIRALTKGDVTKEKEIFAMDVWRALTELDAQAEDYEELKKMNHGK